MDNKASFLKNHADTLAIIGVNLCIAAILVSMWISNSHRIDAVNARMDATMSRIDGMYHILMQRKE